MSELITASADPQNVVESTECVVEKPVRQPVFIGEREVAFSTAAAAALPRAKPSNGLKAALRAMLLSSSAQTADPVWDRVPPRHYAPRREAFLESAAMAREMHRL